MFENCQSGPEKPGHKCSEVAEKLVQLFGWRQTYKVEKLQRSLTLHDSVRKTYSLNNSIISDKVQLKETLSDPVALGGVNAKRVQPSNNNRIPFTRDKYQKSYLSLNSSGRSSDSWVAVQSLQTSDGGILDPDDRLNDVADDREQIIATFSDGDGPHHGGGDGASGSSVGTGSPDIFQADGKYFNPTSDIEVTSDQLDQLGANPLQVRRGSEPALNQIEGTNGPSGSLQGPPVSNNANKRWSAAPIILDVDQNNEKTKKETKLNGYMDTNWKEEEEKTSFLSVNKFERDGSNRLSMQFLTNGTGLRWMDAADKVNLRGSSRSSHSSSLPRDHRRREPLGQANSISPTRNRTPEYNDVIEEEANLENTHSQFVVLRNEAGPLGIHVVPDYDNSGRDRGLLVQGIEPGGRVHRDGRLAVYDRIIEINGSNLLNKPFQKVQEIFKNSLVSEELRLRVIKHRAPSSHRPPPPIFPSESMVEGHERAISSSKVATVSPTKKLPTGASMPLLTANTRKMGRRIDLELLKGPAGLGFSITTRDNPAGGNCPIYIKNILPKGAAVDDGRLRPGDRLLDVNGIEMTGKSQAEAVAVLRQAPAGSMVKISVSRQEDVHHIKEESLAEPPPKKQERCIDDRGVVGRRISEDRQRLNDSPKKAEKSIRTDIFPWRQREILTFDIPVHDTEKAGLGVSVKGKTSASHSGQPSLDLGIFVKSVINGGAASRDGRLRTNDQLLCVNGKSLLNQSNSNAMETLRRAMLYTEGPTPGVISLTVARRIPNSVGSASSLLSNSSGNESMKVDSENPTSEHSNASETSGSTVIFLPNKHDTSLDLSVKSDLNETQSSVGSQKDYSLRNPVIERITGQSNSNIGQHSNNNVNNALRNESYYRATHETTWNTSNMVNNIRGGKLNSPTVNPALAEPVLIEDDYHTTPNHCPRDKQYSDIRMPQEMLKRDLSRVDESISGSGQSIATTPGDVTYASQLSLDENAAGFTRDAVGRQSMSEKRHATLDAKNTDTYRRNKKIREERQHPPQQGVINSKIAEIRQELFRERVESRGKTDIGPYLGMKKSSSLESLQTMVQEIQMAEDPDPAYTYRNSQGTVRVIRGRGCNESFRAAVDRSYDAPLGLRNQMETQEEERNHVDCNLGRGTPRQSSMNAARDSKLKLSKKKPGLLKGIGSMFRFGKHRKPMESGLQGGLEEEEEYEERQKEEAKLAAIEEHEKIQDHYRKLMIKQHQDNHIPQFHSQSQDSSNHSDNRKYYREENRMDENKQTSQSNFQNRSNHIYHSNNSKNRYYQPNQRTDEAHKNQRTEEIQRNQNYEPRNKQYETRSKENEKEEHYGSSIEQKIKQFESKNGEYKNIPRVEGRKGHELKEPHRKFSLDSRNMEYQFRDTRSEVRPIEEEEDYNSQNSSHSRSRRIHQLRAEHQRKHVERRGQYPLDDREEKYEQVIRQKLDQDIKAHRRSSSYDIYGEMGRPGSRVGIADPARFSHYVNYEEIQQHLNRRQQHYHSQRRDNREQHQRPVSNFYEYESVQNIMRPKTAANPTDEYPSRFHNSPSVKSTINYLNSIANTKPTSNGVRTKHDINNIRSRGPYISQITITENPNES